MKSNKVGPVNLHLPRAPKLSLSKAAEKFSTLQPQEVILGLFGEYVANGAPIWSGGLVNLLGDLGFSTAASRIAINRVCSRELLDSQRDGRFIFYVISDKLATIFKDGRHRTFFTPDLNPAWNGQWTFVLYLESESSKVDPTRNSRARLGRWLTLRDFGMLQEGAWIAANSAEADARSLLKRLGLESQVLVFTTSLSDQVQIATVIERAWDLPLLARLYASFVSKFSSAIPAAEAGKLSPKQAFVSRTKLIEMFRKMSALDPNLPDSMLDISWQRSEALQLFQTLHPLLEEKAAHHFHESATKIE